MIKYILLFSLALLGCSHEFANGEVLKDQVFESNGDQRTYDMYLPQTDSNRLSPLVLLLHGHGGSADVMTGENNKKAPYKAWQTIADREGWILLIPDGEFGSDNYRGWNDCRANNTKNPITDDVKFLNQLVDTVSQKYPINQDRIYAHGTSNGGHMTYRLAQESGKKFRAIAAIVAAMPEKNKCQKPNTPISVLVMNGTRDPFVPYNGGAVGRRKSTQQGRGSVLSTSETIQYWLDHNGITTRPKVTILPNRNKRDGSTVRMKQYFQREQDTEVVLYEVAGGGHTEPSLSEHYHRLYKVVVGQQNRDIEMAEEVWRFFERNR